MQFCILIGRHGTSFAPGNTCKQFFHELPFATAATSTNWFPRTIWMLFFHFHFKGPVVSVQLHKVYPRYRLTPAEIKTASFARTTRIHSLVVHLQMLSQMQRQSGSFWTVFVLKVLGRRTHTHTFTHRISKTFFQLCNSQLQIVLWFCRWLPQPRRTISISSQVSRYN